MKKRNKRESAKYPALKKGLNLRSRRDYIEPEYINGVYDANGKEVIRPLTAEEKEWLNKFYEETVVTSFKKNGTDFLDSVEERRAAYRDNNHRNACLMNVKSATGQLDCFDEKAFDRISYDRFSYLDHELVMINEILAKDEEDKD